MERDERVLTGESGGSRHLRKGISCHEDLDEHTGHNARPPIRDLRLHRVYPHLTCSKSGHFKGNICYPGLTIAHLPLRAPVYLEWFLHLPSLDAVTSYNWSARNIRLGHNKLEIPLMTTCGRAAWIASGDCGCPCTNVIFILLFSYLVGVAFYGNEKKGFTCYSISPR